jgi:hypothetical protein
MYTIHKTKFAVLLLPYGSTTAVTHCCTAKNTFIQKIYEIKELQQFETICMTWVGSVAEVRIEVCWLCWCVNGSHHRRLEYHKLLFYFMQSFISVVGEFRTSRICKHLSCHTSLQNTKANHHLPKLHFIHFTDVSATHFISTPCMFTTHYSCCIMHFVTATSTLHVVLDQYVSLGQLLHNGYSLYQKTVNISEDAT